jgi:hypothetical protein
MRQSPHVCEQPNYADVPVRDRLRDRPKRLQEPFSAKSRLQTRLQNKFGHPREPADV